MCAEYWPQKLNALYECGNMTIKLIKEENFEYHDIRVLEICYDIYTRKIQHLHLKWHSSDEIPFYPNALVPVVKHIRKINRNSEVPIVIHSGYIQGVPELRKSSITSILLEILTFSFYYDSYTSTAHSKNIAVCIQSVPIHIKKTQKLCFFK
jgi:hypothetical protein